MKHAAWACWRSERSSETLLHLGLWLVGLPMCLAILFLILRPVDVPAPTRFAQAEIWSEELRDYRFDKAGFAAMQPQRPDFRRASWQTVALPLSVPLPTVSSRSESPALARLWLRLRYTPPADMPPATTLALYGSRIMGGAYAVWLGDQLIDSSLDDWRMQWNTPLLARLPATAVVPGRPLEILLALPYRVSQGYAVGTLHLGSLEAIKPLHAWRVFFQSSLPQAGILVALLLGLVALQFWLARRSETPHLLMAINAVAWFFANLQYFIDFSDDEQASLWFGALVDAAISWVVVLSFLFAMQFDRRRVPWLEKLLVLYAVAVSLLTLPAWNWPVNALLFQHALNLLLAIGLSLLVLWRSRRGGSLEYRMLGVALLVIPILGGYDVLLMTSQRFPDGYYVSQYSTFVLFGAFLFSLQRRYLSAIDGIEKLNDSLDQRLRQREAELEAEHRQRRAAERRQVSLQERQRLMQDMHDGVGSTLLAAATQLELGRLTVGQATEVLRACIDDLRLVIDSLDADDGDLAELLAALRHRLDPRFAAAGIVLDWHVAEWPSPAWLSASQILQILRIVQEALSNVLKHAAANRVRIAVAPAGDGGVAVEIDDNGRGFDPATLTDGRGLRNIRDRARRIGADVDIGPAGEHGSRVRLHLPPPSVAAD